MSTTSTQGTALITGASSGIGATYADRLAKRGFDLLLVARDQTRLETLAAELRAKTSVTVEVLRADLTSAADISSVEQRLRSDASITLLLNNAGVASNSALAEADMGEVDRLIQLNIVALTHLASAAAAGFLARGRGAIVNIASVVPMIPERFNAVYTASKAYVLSRSMPKSARGAFRFRRSCPARRVQRSGNAPAWTSMPSLQKW